MKITNLKVYGLEDSIVDSGLAKSDDPEYSEDRAITLGTSKQGSGHDCYLKGIIVQYRLTADHTFWLQFMRYHFHDIVSSTSKMHSIDKMNLKFNDFVLNSSKLKLKELITIYNNNKTYPIIYEGKIIDSKQEMFEVVVANAPLGLELTAKITDNYLQLKSKWFQRRGHKTTAWQDYCNWIETLPKFKEIVIKKS